jgi:hypothetical protein
MGQVVRILGYFTKFLTITSVPLFMGERDDKCLEVDDIIYAITSPRERLVVEYEVCGLAYRHRKGKGRETLPCTIFSSP